MNIFNLPNFLSLGNLLCGCIATLNVVKGNLESAALLIAIACVFDFLDGFAARGLKQGSPMGKELDSLADMVTFGVVPGMIMFQLIRFVAAPLITDSSDWLTYLPYIGFVIPLFSGLRLAKFNVDTRQSDSFIGLPTLANAVFMAGLPFALTYGSEITEVSNDHTTLTYLTYGLVLLAVVMSVLLVSGIPMFSFKIKQVGWKGNEIRYVFILISVALVILFRSYSISLIVLVYILLSLVNWVLMRGKNK